MRQAEFASSGQRGGMTKERLMELMGQFEASVKDGSYQEKKWPGTW